MCVVVVLRVVVFVFVLLRVRKIVYESGDSGVSVYIVIHYITLTPCAY